MFNLHIKALLSTFSQVQHTIMSIYSEHSRTNIFLDPLPDLDNSWPLSANVNVTRDGTLVLRKYVNPVSGNKPIKPCSWHLPLDIFVSHKDKLKKSPYISPRLELLMPTHSAVMMYSCVLQAWSSMRSFLGLGRRRDWKDASKIKPWRVLPGTSLCWRYWKAKKSIYRTSRPLFIWYKLLEQISTVLFFLSSFLF